MKHQISLQEKQLYTTHLDSDPQAGRSNFLEIPKSKVDQILSPPTSNPATPACVKLSNSFLFCISQVRTPCQKSSNPEFQCWDLCETCGHPTPPVKVSVGTSQCFLQFDSRCQRQDLSTIWIQSCNTGDQFEFYGQAARSMNIMYGSLTPVWTLVLDIAWHSTMPAARV